MSNIRSLSDLKNSGGPPSRGPPGGGPPGGGFPGFPGFPGMGAPSNAPESKNIRHLRGDESALQAELRKAGSKLVVIDFTATWCGPCKMIAPVYSELADKYPDVIFFKVDVDESSDIAQACGVKAMPTFQFYRNSKKIGEFSGASPDKLKGEVDRHRSSAPSGTDAAPTGGSTLTGGGYVLGSAKPGDTTFNSTIPSILRNPPNNVASASNPVPASTPSSISDDTPSSTSSSASDPMDTDVNEVFLANLMDMGFSRAKAERALKTTGGSNLESAMDWCLNHPDEEPTTSSSTSSSTPTTSAPTAPSTTASGEPQKVNLEHTDQQIFDQMQNEENFGKKPLTPEELAEQKRRLDEKIQKLREAKAKDEAQREIEREINRRKSGKDAVEAKKKWEENSRAREEMLRKKEKDDEKKARERIKAKLEQDKQERLAAKAKNAEQNVAASVPPPTVAAQPSQPAVKKEYTECAVQVRLPDGNVIKASFKPLDTVRTVHDHISLLTNNLNFSLMTTFPRKVYSPKDKEIDSTTLTQAEVVPSGTFIVTML